MCGFFFFTVFFFDFILLYVLLHVYSFFVLDTKNGSLPTALKKKKRKEKALGRELLYC